MPLTETQLETVAAFRAHIESVVKSDERYGHLTRHDRDDGSLLASRFEMAPKCWLEVAVRPLIPQVRIGFVTTDRWKSEDAEGMIEDSGDSMPEFVGVGFNDAGLDWDEPPVEHFREAGEYFYFATPFDLDDVLDLNSDATRDKTVRMLEGYLIAFGPSLEMEEEE